MNTQAIVYRLASLAVLLMLMGGGHLSSATAGKDAPDFTLPTHDGKSLTLSNLEGKRGVVLVFFATWCPPCMAEVPHVKKLVEATRDSELIVYGVNVQQPLRIVEKFVAEKEVNYRILLDEKGAVARDYEVQGIPLVVGIDRDGVIRYRAHGLPENTEELVKILTAPSTKKGE